MRVVSTGLIAAAALMGAFGAASAAPASGLAVANVAPQAETGKSVEKAHGRRHRHRHYYSYRWGPRYYGYYSSPYYYDYYPAYYYYRPYRRSGVYLGFRF